MRRAIAIAALVIFNTACVPQTATTLSETASVGEEPALVTREPVPKDATAAKEPGGETPEPPAAEQQKESTESIAAPVGYVPYNNPKYGLALYHPPEWTVDPQPDGSFVVRPEDRVVEPDIGSDWIAIGADWPEYSDMSPEDVLIPGDSLAPVAEAILWDRAEFMYLLLQIHPMEQKGEVETSTSNGQQKARAVFDAGIKDRLGLFYLHVIQDEDLVAIAFAFPSASSPALNTIESIMDTITISERTYEPAGDLVPVAVGQLYEGSWIDGQQVDHSFTLNAGSPVLALFQFLGDILAPHPEANVELYGAGDEYIQGFYAGLLVQMQELNPVSDGEYKLSFTPRYLGSETDATGAYRLLVFEPRLGARGIIDILDGKLEVGQEDEIKFDGHAGETLVVVIQGSEDFSPRTKILDPEGDSLTYGFIVPSFGEDSEAEIIQLTLDGQYSARVSQAGAESGAYRLVLFKNG